MGSACLGTFVSFESLRTNGWGWGFGTNGWEMDRLGAMGWDSRLRGNDVLGGACVMRWGRG